MLNSFPQSAGDVELTFATYRAALDDFSEEAITKTCGRFVGGIVGGVNKAFAPSLAQFCEEAREVTETIRIMNQPRVAPPAVGRRPDLMAKAERQRAAHQNRRILAENVNHEMYLKMVKRRELAPGTRWVAALGIIYGPEPKAGEEAA